MKTKKWLIVIGLLITLYSCKNVNGPEEPFRPGFKVKILKISNPEYMGNVLACYEDLIHYQICATEWLHCNDLFLETSPYVHLADDYYLLDWKWELYLCSECVLLSCQWENVKNRYQTWKRNEAIATIAEFVDEILYTSRENIDNYLQITPAPVSKEWWSASADYPNLSADYERPWFPTDTFTTIANLPDTLYNNNGHVYTKFNFLEEVARQDSLQEVYVERLKIIMQETRLSKFAYNKYRL